MCPFIKIFLWCVSYICCSFRSSSKWKPEQVISILTDSSFSSQPDDTTGTDPQCSSRLPALIFSQRLTYGLGKNPPDKKSMQFTVQCVGTLVRSESAHSMQKRSIVLRLGTASWQIYIPGTVLAFRLTSALPGKVMTNECYYTGVALYHFHTYSPSMSWHSDPF